MKNSNVMYIYYCYCLNINFAVILFYYFIIRFSVLLFYYLLLLLLLRRFRVKRYNGKMRPKHHHAAEYK